MYKILSVISLGLMLGACSEPAEEVKAPPIRSVKLYTVEMTTLTQSRRFIGKTSASTSAKLSFPINGKVISMMAEKGAEVKQGQIIAKLDPTDFLQAKQAANASVQQAQVEYNNKQSDYLRKKPLGEKGIITLKDLDEANTKMLSANEQLNIAKSNLQDANNRLADTVLKAPYDGVISEREIDEFTEVSVGQTVYVIEANEQEIEVEFSIPEMMLSYIKEGMEVSVSIDNDVTQHTGTVSEISPSASVGNVFEVKALIDNTDKPIKSGLAADVRLEMVAENEDAHVLIPVNAIMSKGDEAIFVYVFDEDSSTLIQTSVQKGGIVSGNELAVSGLKEGDRIVTAGVSFLADGLKVKPYVAAE